MVAQVTSFHGSSGKRWLDTIAQNPRLAGGVASIAAVLLLCRGLIVGRGGYQLYVDPALPASRILMHNTCAGSLNLWSSGNLGYRVLVPGNYMVCAVINTALDAGVPAWAISRLLPVLCLCVGALGMTLLLFEVRKRVSWLHLQSVDAADWLAAPLVGILYACSPYSFNEAAASHFTYLVAIALFPWTALILSTWKNSAISILAAGGLLGIAYSQLQFAIIAPAALIILAWMFGSRGFAVRGLAAGFVGLIPHLAWIAPLMVYPAAIPASTYLEPGTDIKFAIRPIDAVRLVGYVTPFMEMAVRSWEGVWRGFSFEALVVAGAGIFCLPAKRAAALLVVAVCWIYQWGALAPGYPLWSRVVPVQVAGLFRERYSVGFVTLVVLAILIYLGIVLISRKSVRLGVVAGVVAAVSFAAPFVDGHLGPYGQRREDFSAAEQLTSFIQAQGGGPVLTIPTGSIVQGADWAYLGRSPFSVGGPSVLDTNGAPNASALPLVDALVGSLAAPAGSTPVSAAEYLKILRIRYVVEWHKLTSTAPIDEAAIRGNLAKLGAKKVMENSSATLWQFPGSATEKLRVTDSIYLASQIHDGVVDQSRLWQAALAISQSHSEGDVLAIAEKSGGLVHFATRRVAISRNGIRIMVEEPVLVVHHGQTVSGTAVYEGSAIPGSIPVFADGTVIPVGRSILNVTGPVSRIGVGAVYQVITDRTLARAITYVQDTDNTSGGTLSAAGITARSEALNGPDAGAIALSAVRDEAGLPIELTSHSGKIAVTFESKQVAGGPSNVALVINGDHKVASLPLPTSSNWTKTDFESVLPANTASAYLYFYVRGSNGSTPSKALLRHLSGSIAAPINSDAAPLNFLYAIREASSTAPTLTSPAARIAVNPAEMASTLQDTAALGRGTFDASTQPSPNDPDGVPALSISAVGDEAGLPVQLPLLLGNYSVSMYVKHAGGSQSRVAILANGDTIVASANLPNDRGWRKVTLVFTPPPTARDLYLYLYVPGGAKGLPTRQIVGGVHATVTPFFEDVVVSNPGCANQLLGPLAKCGPSPGGNTGEWLSQYDGADAWWRPSGVTHSALLPAAANGFGNTWFISGGSKNHRTLAVAYLPDQLFKAIARLVLLGAVVAIAFVLGIAVWRRWRSNVS